ncbi:hypothetical protein Pla144_13910 [Bythopirellula polymerisocia]|uniref:Uncharacterized protein n=1 Tax=Bythopirellula polymerisocia TaxID=2528003 RepID=A0A5C6CWK8_9BACT|nr:hypothetical protein Pla144_13910 [Bythopirellula polymerisocia]
MWKVALCEYQRGRSFQPKKEKITGTITQVSYRESLDQYLRVVGAKLAVAGLLTRIQELRKDDGLARIPR